ncbi:MAG: DMT family transporter [Microcella sp.]|uniref:DMT family transporter n=1 Tax=Microcella sp. TaxID=1913979 RepID=UPI0024C5EDC1|nr:DMT family transporter [Microcella sp.]UYN83731.1 MAG: DMT family transporter [Microcella sp.]
MNLLRRYSPAVLAQLFWAMNFVVADRVIAEFTPLELTFLRWLGAFPILLVITVFIERRHRDKWRLAAREWWIHVIQAVLGMVGYTLLLYAALETTSPVNASVISAVNPALIALAAVVVLGERIRRGGVLGIVISFVGVVIVVVLGGSAAVEGFSIVPGDLLILGAIATWTAYVIISRRITTPPITATTVQVGLSALMLAPVMAIVGIQAQPTAEGWWGLALIIVFPSALAYLLWNVAVTQLGPSRTGVFLNLLPVFTAIIAVSLGDALTVWQVIGGLVVLAGVYLTTRPGATVAAVDARAEHPPRE